MACDLGEVRVGVALSDLSRTLASPHGIVKRDANLQRNLAAIVDEYEVTDLVVGLPVPLRGHHSAQLDAYREEASDLGTALSVRVHVVDERFTTVIAQQQRAHRGRRTRTDIDAEAAAILLQNFLDKDASA